MTIAIGIGCRANVSVEAVLALVEPLLAELPAPPIGLFTAAVKAGDGALLGAAAALGLTLVALPDAALRAVADRTLTAAPAALSHFGLPSVSEAAALAAFSGRARLIVPRRVAGGVTVAAAEEIE